MRGDPLSVRRVSFGLEILGNGIKTDVEMEIPKLELGDVLCINRKFTLILINRPEVFKILAIDQSGMVSELYDGRD